MRQVLVIIAVAGGCVSPDSVECGHRVCPKGTTCIELAAVSAGDPHRCVDPDAVTACSGVTTLDPCSYTDVSMGACYATMNGEVCLPASCGNGLVDRGEVCDDGNAEVNDGCSDACKSDETCGNGIVDPSKLEVCDDGNRLGHDGCAPGCVSEVLRWTPLTPGDPTPRVAPAITYDSIRARIVMFGGNFVPSGGGGAARPQPQAGTYESDGTTWNRATLSLEPSPRLSTALAFDGARRVSVMFGGDDGALRGDTWTWDGVSWRLATASGPPARSQHSIAYDMRRKRVVLFGGVGAAATSGGPLTPLSDTWEWDGTAWTQMAPTASPPASSASAMTYDPGRGVIVLVAADDTDAYRTWEYDGASWTMKADSTATPKASSIAYDAVMSRIIAYAARDAAVTTFTWDGTSWTDAGDASAGAPYGPALASEPGGHVVQFGGLYTTCFAGCFSYSSPDTYGWNGSTWSKHVTASPTERAYATAALDSRRGVIVMIGGESPNGGSQIAFDEEWDFDGFSWTLSPSAPWSSGRFRAALAYDSARDEMVAFGGDDPATLSFSNETWVRSGAGTWQQASPATTPGVRTGAVAAYDPVRHRVVLFGGADSSAVSLDETWVWDGTTWSHAAPAHKPAGRASAAISWDPLTQTVVLFGGRGASNQLLGDTWSWDGTDWAERTTPTGPPPRRDGRLAWSGALGVLLLHGGAGSAGLVDDHWAWTGTEWLVLSGVDRPAPSIAPAFASAPDGAGVFMFGGTDTFESTVYSTANELRSDGPVAYEECATAMDADGDGQAGCADPDCWARCAPQCSPGTPCDAAAPHCGDGVCNAALENCRNCASDCTTCAPRCGDSFCDPGESAAACPGDCTP